MESKLSGRKISTGEGVGRGRTIRDPQNLVVETRATWRLHKVSIFHPPRQRVFHFPFFFSPFLIFPRSMDFLTRNRGIDARLEKFSGKSRCSGNIQIESTRGGNPMNFLFLSFFIDARTDRISFAYDFIEAVQHIFQSINTRWRFIQPRPIPNTDNIKFQTNCNRLICFFKQ